MANKYAICTYCGSYASDRDHIIPKSLRRGHKNPKTVPACQECNVLLSDNSIFEVRDRAYFLLNKYIDRGIELDRLKWLCGVALVELEDIPFKFVRVANKNASAAFPRRLEPILDEVLEVDPEPATLAEAKKYYRTFK